MDINDIIKNIQYAMLSFITDMSTICTISLKMMIYDHSTSVIHS
jgi:hypothetical protein